MLRTHTCGELRAEHDGASVQLCGWVHRRRDHGGLIFIDLRDRWGLTQIVFDPDVNAEAHEVAGDLRREFVIQASGNVRLRPTDQENPNIVTGQVEVEITQLEVLNKANTPPFEIDKESNVDEKLRLQYRYLDLRRERMQRNIVLRHNVVRHIRNFLSDQSFVEVETPILFKTTPEGARDYLVPSRVHPGEFYALPQSPQQLKQLIMVAGYDRYFQIARCFRDEDQRGDRQPEFTQLDLEMSFISREDILQLIEQLMLSIAESYAGDKKLFSNPFTRLSYHEAMDRFGRDNPDIRFGLELSDLSDIVANTEFKVFRTIVAKGGLVKGFNGKGLASYSRKQLDGLTDYVKTFGAKGLAWLKVVADDAGNPAPGGSSFAKFLSAEEISAIIERLEGQPGDLLMLVADKYAVTNEALGRLRLEIGDRLGLRDDNVLAFCWVIDFPFVNWNEDEQRWDPSHHLFTSPMAEDVPLLSTDPGKARGQQYDLVLNGNEIAGGSIRIHQRDLQEKVFELIGLEFEEAKHQFGHMLEAFEFGTPPHGGIASGIDRLVMLMADEPNIREVIAFPKSQNAADLMAGAPTHVTEKQLRELHIRLALPKK